MMSPRVHVAVDVTLAMSQEGPFIAIVLDGINAVEQVRKMVGTTEPKSAAPGTIRGDYAHVSFDYANSKGLGIRNLIHASGDVDDAKQEIVHRFSKKELLTSEPGNEKCTRTR